MTARFELCRFSPDNLNPVIDLLTGQPIVCKQGFLVAGIVKETGFKIAEVKSEVCAGNPATRPADCAAVRSLEEHGVNSDFARPTIA